jgi:hypothetical protein
MATVFDNSQVVHLWARQGQLTARNPKQSLSFVGETLFSYRMPLARHVKGTDGAAAVLLAAGRFSVTTAHHRTQAERACVRWLAVFHVPNVRPCCVAEHLDNLRHLGKRIDEAADKSARARTEGNRIWWKNHAAAATCAYRDYARFFGLDDVLAAATLSSMAVETPAGILADWCDEHDRPELAARLRKKTEF